MSNLLELAIQKVEEINGTPLPYSSTIDIWTSADGKTKAYLKNVNDGIDLHMYRMVRDGDGRRIPKYAHSQPLGIAHLDYGTGRWVISKALHGLKGAVLGHRVNRPDSCYAAWVEDTKKRLGI